MRKTFCLTPDLVSRRGFLVQTVCASVGAGAAACLNPQGSAQEPAARQAQLRFGFTTYQWGKDWDIAALIANLTKAEVYGAELRTSSGYAHGVELTLSDQQRRDVRQRFADSPVELVGLATGERMDWPEPEKLQAAVENSKAFVKLSHDIGGSGVRVFPNQFHPSVPRKNDRTDCPRPGQDRPVRRRLRPGSAAGGSRRSRRPAHHCGHYGPGDPAAAFA